MDEINGIQRAPGFTNRRGEKPFVMMDGFNLGLEKGTGVATYARNLSFSLRDLGAEVGVLYGGSFVSGMPDLLKEIAFFDSQGITLNRWQRYLKRMRKVFGLHFNRAFQVPIQGAVVSDNFKSRLPHFDSIWNSPDLFVKASVQHDIFGVINRVRVSGRRPDLFHWTYPLPLHAPGVPNIYTLHDMVPLRLPFTTLDRKREYLRMLRWIARRADHIITVSEHSKRDIVDILGIPENRVTNTYQAVSIPDKYRLKPDEVVRREVEGTFGLRHKEYFLFFGSIEPKKNIGRMLEGYLGSSVETPLVVVGAQAWKSEQELRLLYEDHIRSLVQIGSETRVKRKVIQLEYAPFPLLVSLIRGAKAVLFPSLYEGFGLPILESMLLGTPVLTSKTSAVPEVAGEAALLVNPYDPREIAEGVRALDANPGLREELSAKGRVQAGRFTERAYGDRLAAVYREVLNRR